MKGEKEREIVEESNLVELGTSHVTKLANKSSIKKRWVPSSSSFPD